MATITSNGTGGGLSNSTSSWAGGVVPVEGDKVRIIAGDTIELNATHVWGDDTVVNTIGSSAVNVYLGGTLKASRSTNSSLTGKGNILVEQGGTLDFGTVASPIPAGVTCTLILNKATTPAVRDGLRQITPVSGAGNFINWSFVGDDTRERVCTLASNATSGSANIVLTTATHGWSIGDEILLPTSSGAPTVDETELSTVSSMAGATITLSSAPTYTHLAGAKVANLSSNLVVRSFNEVSGQMANPNCLFPTSPATPATLGYYLTFHNARFQSLGNTGTNSGVLTVSGGNNCPKIGMYFNKCTLKNTVTAASWCNGTLGKTTVFDKCVAYMKGGLLYGNGRSLFVDGCFVTSILLTTVQAGNKWVNCWMSCTSAGYLSAANQTFEGCTFSGYATSFISTSSAVGVILKNCDIGKTYGWKNQFGDRLFRMAGLTYSTSSILIEDCLVATALEIPESIPNVVAQSELGVVYINKNQDTTAQEIYTNTSLTARENTLTNRSTSSTNISPLVVGTDCTQTQKILCTNGSSIRVIGYCRFDTAFYNSNNYNAPTVFLSGLGATTQTFTASSAANGAWEKFDLTITNASGVDGNFTLTYTANAQAVTTGKVYFDGVPNAPFITKCRHYGFTFDEANPARTVNGAISASEATAAAYTNITVSGTTSAVSLGANKTFQEVYDYTQAWACLNLAKLVPLSGSGIAGSPSLTANAAVSTTGFVLSGSGSLNMGAFTLAGSLPWVYTYTGGTFSQATTVPAFNGGQLNISAAGTYTFVMAGSTIVSMTPTAPGTYNLGATSFTGTVDLRNAAAHAITVQLPAGAAYTTASNVGGAITVTLPATYQSVAVSGLEVGSRVQIYDLTSSTELANDVAVASTYTWTDSVAASASRAIRLRVAYVDGTDAKQFIEASIGTCGTTTGDAGIGYLASQVDDTVYIANAVNGSTVTECSIVGTNLFVDVNAGSITISRIYAFMVYWLSTVGGIADQSTEMVAKDTANYVVNTGFKIRNATTGPTIPLLITGGNIDPATGVATDILDTSGGSIFVNSSIVVPYSSGAEATVAIVQAGLSAQGFTAPVAARIDAPVSTRATVGDLPSVPSAATIATAVLGAAVEGDITLEQATRILVAHAAGNATGLEGSSPEFKSLDGSKTRIAGSYTAGTRTVTVLDGS